jgi:hypothetical protein
VFELFNHIFKENYEQLYRRSSAKVPLTPLKLLWDFITCSLSQICKIRNVLLPDISYFTELRQTRCDKKISKTVLFWKLDSKSKKPRLLRKISCGLFLEPLKETIFSASGIFTEDYVRNLTCWEKQESLILSTPQKFVYYLLGRVINEKHEAL